MTPLMTAEEVIMFASDCVDKEREAGAKIADGQLNANQYNGGYDTENLRRAYRQGRRDCSAFIAEQITARGTVMREDPQEEAEAIREVRGYAEAERE